MMKSDMRPTISRRAAIERSILAATTLAVPGALAEQLATASMVEGPFYPDKLPLDTDNDLIILNDSLTPAVGEITHLSGRVLTTAGSPMRNVTVEIWQVDHQGIYLHSGDKEQERRDANFQSYGRFLTDTQGRYYFRTIKPVAYGDGRIRRTPHIHIAVSRGDKRLLTTQLLVNGVEQNQTDMLFKRIKDPKAQATVLGDFSPLPGSKLGELQVNHDLIIGQTVAEMDDGSLRALGVSIA